MTALDSQRRSRPLALALLAGVLLLPCVLIIWPLWQVNQQLQTRLDGQRDTLIQQQRLLRQAEALKAELNSIQTRRTQVAASFLTGPSTDLATAQLQGLIKAGVQRVGGQLVSTRIQPERLEGGHRRLTVDVKLRLHTPGLVALLRQFQSNRPLLSVDRLTVRALIIRTQGLPETRPLDLDVGLSVSGYVAAKGGV